MLITEKVKVFGTPVNVSRYKNLGYEISYHEYTYVKVEDLPKNSKIKVDVICDYCNKEFKKCWCNYIRGKNSIDKDACSNCCGKKNSEIWNIRYDNDHNVYDSINKKREATTIERYGCKNVSQVKEFANKREETNIMKYGCKNPYQNIEVQNKMRQTMVEKYGVQYAMQNQDILRKSRDTCYKNYGVYFCMQSEEILNRCKIKSLEKYGTEYPIQSEEVQRLIRSIFRDKYGVDYPLQNLCILNKTFESMRKNNKHFVLISKEQKELSEIYKCELNKKIGTYYVDLFFDKYDIVCEYDGGGHNLSVKIGEISQCDFDSREMNREKYIISCGYKIIRIVNRNDKTISKELAVHIKNDGIKTLLNSNYNVYIYDINSKKIECR